MTTHRLPAGCPGPLADLRRQMLTVMPAAQWETTARAVALVGGVIPIPPISLACMTSEVGIIAIMRNCDAAGTVRGWVEGQMLICPYLDTLERWGVPVGPLRWLCGICRQILATLPPDGLDPTNAPGPQSTTTGARMLVPLTKGRPVPPPAVYQAALLRVAAATARAGSAATSKAVYDAADKAGGDITRARLARIVDINNPATGLAIAYLQAVKDVLRDFPVSSVEVRFLINDPSAAGINKVRAYRAAKDAARAEMERRAREGGTIVVDDGRTGPKKPAAGGGLAIGAAALGLFALLR